MFSRRDMLAVSAAGAVMTASAARAASFGNPDQPPEGAINATGSGNLKDPGPKSDVIGSQFPSAQFPPATDVGGMPMDWASFNNAPKRIQNGGWARQVTQEDFAISKTITGVNMRLTAGGIRELHWHQAAEWAIMTYGSCRVTVLDAVGRPYVADVNEGDLWYFPAGQPHSLQGLGPDGCEFVICFDDGDASEFNTLLVTDWFAHTLPRCLPRTLAFPPRPSPGSRCRISGSSREGCPAIWHRTARPSTKMRPFPRIPLSSGLDPRLRSRQTWAARCGWPTAPTSTSQPGSRPHW
jgi:oxalate decarboxylase